MLSNCTRFGLVSALLLGAASAAAAVGCAAPSAESENTGSSDNAITGITDLTEMETAMGLWKDVKDAQGNWSRPEAKLVAGPCYQKLMTGADAAGIQFRRYSNGAAFFSKETDALGAGAERPVLCVDVDVDYSDRNDGASTIMVSDIEIDSVLRYRLGAPTGGDGAAGTFYDDFKYGTVSYHGGYCNESSNDWFDPLSPAALGSYCFGSVDFPGNSDMLGDLQILVYQYAYEHGTASNRFSTAADAVGRFVSMSGDVDNQHVHFEKLDAHATRSADGNIVKLYLTPKNNDATFATSAVAACTLTQANEHYDVKCTGL